MRWMTLPALATLMVASGFATPRELSFSRRVDYEMRLQLVFDRHREWASAAPKPPFEARYSRADMEGLVRAYLRQSDLAEGRRRVAFADAELDREVGRIRASSRAPAVLAELLAALDDDPAVIRECLARRTLAARLVSGRASTPGLCGYWSPQVGWTSTQVWTGTEMILWGPSSAGARYDPATDSWRPTSLSGAPAPRSYHTAVWTGSEMVVWGGGTSNDGGRYDPTTDSWRSTNFIGAPSVRMSHTAIWTGSEMLVWGGYFGSTIYDSGAAYSPSTDTWRTLATQGAPSARRFHTAVWTGSEMIVWGGQGSTGTYWTTGGRYDPASDRWLPTSVAGAPTPRDRHSASWCGNVMVVWGGHDGSVPLADGGRYDPSSDSWIPVAATGAPSARANHATTWTGARMLLWGGGNLNVPGNASGAGYDPVLDAWAPTRDAPESSTNPLGVWTGSEIFYWDGYSGLGLRYDPARDTWVRMSSGGPRGGSGASSTWTGVELILWGGYTGYAANGTGARYDAATDTWLPISEVGAPTPRARHTAIWSGAEMVVWGGYDAGYQAIGGRYDPVTDSWQAMAIAGQPQPRAAHTAVWTGSEMIVWGATTLGDGGRYAPATDSWQPMSLVGAPSPRELHTAVWTGTEMLVWGGQSTISGVWPTDGALYDPVSDTWRSMAVGPTGRYLHAASWTGRWFIVWGGRRYFNFNDGARYEPASDTWTQLSTIGAPGARYNASAQWTGSEVVVWGGVSSQGNFLDTGARLDPAAGTWRSMTTVGAPSPRADPASAWTGSALIYWGGGELSGRSYDPVSDTWAPCSPAADEVLAGKYWSGGSPGASVRALRRDGTTALALADAFPSYLGDGAKPAGGDVDGSGGDELLVTPSPSGPLPARVRGFDTTATAIPGLDFIAYGSTDGADVGAGSIDGNVRILTGPGPAPSAGPHVRGFAYASGSVQALSKVSFYAYGTLRYGVNVGATELDGDGYDEIVTGAGGGAVFGPHVRAFDYDGQTVTGRAKVTFYAYGTPRYGVEIGSGDVDGDGFDEILTGPGPSPAFGPHLRGFDVAGGTPATIPPINAFVFVSAWRGLNVAGAELDGDDQAEIACGPGPDPGFGSRLRVFALTTSGLAALPPLDLDVYGAYYGLRVGAADLGP